MRGVGPSTTTTWMWMWMRTWMPMHQPVHYLHPPPPTLTIANTNTTPRLLVRSHQRLYRATRAAVAVVDVSDGVVVLTPTCASAGVWVCGCVWAVE